MARGGCRLSRVWAFSEGEGKALRFARLSPNGRFCCFGGYDNAATVVRLSDRTVVWRLVRSAPLWSCCWCPKSVRVVLAGLDKKICVVDAMAGVVERETDWGRWLYACDWSGDGAYLAFGGMAPPRGGQEGGGQEGGGAQGGREGGGAAAVVCEVAETAPTPLRSLPTATAAWKLRYAPNSQLLAASFGGGGVSVWVAKVAAKGGPPAFALPSTTRDSRGLSFSSDSKLLAIGSADGSVAVVSCIMETIGEVLFACALEENVPVCAVAFFGENLFVGAWGEALAPKVVDLATGRVDDYVPEGFTTVVAPHAPGIAAVNDVDVRDGVLVCARTDGVLLAVPLYLFPPLSHDEPPLLLKDQRDLLHVVGDLLHATTTTTPSLEATTTTTLNNTPLEATPTSLAAAAAAPRFLVVGDAPPGSLGRSRFEGGLGQSSNSLGRSLFEGGGLGNLGGGGGSLGSSVVSSSSIERSLAFVEDDDDERGRSWRRRVDAGDYYPYRRHPPYPHTPVPEAAASASAAPYVRAVMPGPPRQRLVAPYFGSREADLAARPMTAPAFYFGHHREPVPYFHQADPYHVVTHTPPPTRYLGPPPENYYALARGARGPRVPAYYPPPQPHYAPHHLPRFTIGTSAAWGGGP